MGNCAVIVIVLSVLACLDKDGKDGYVTDAYTSKCMLTLCNYEWEMRVHHIKVLISFLHLKLFTHLIDHTVFNLDYHFGQHSSFFFF